MRQYALMFVQKSCLLLLLLIPFMALLMVFFFKKRKKDLDVLISKANLPVLSNVNLVAYKMKNIFLLLGFIFLIIALARPQYGYKETEIEKTSSEIVIALDVSKSMLAEDIKPSRMEKAKMLISRIIEECEGDKIGVIVFSGVSMWQCPMTYDGEAVKMFLQDVDTDALPFGGTEFSSPINLALKALEGRNSSSIAMVLITDGEDHDKRTSESVEAAEKAGLKIISVGVGTYQGAPIPVKSNDGTLLRYMTDKKNKTVITKLNSGLLRKIASETGGKYFEFSGSGDVTNEIINEIKGTDKQSQGKTKENSRKDRFQIFLLLALAAFIMELFYPKTVKDQK